MPALVQHFEGVAVPRPRGSSAAAAAPADSAPQSLHRASDTNLVAGAERVIAAVIHPAAAEIGAGVHRRWTQSREDAPSVARAATRDSVYGPAASTAAPIRRRTEERASRSEHGTRNPVSAGSDEQSSVTAESARVTMLDASAPGFPSQPSTATGLLVPPEAGSGQLETGRKPSAPGSPIMAGSGGAQVDASTSGGPAPQAASAGGSDEGGVTRTRSERTVRFSSGLLDDVDASMRNGRHAPSAGEDAAGDRAPGDRCATERGEQPLQAEPSDQPDAQVLLLRLAPWEP